jgi:hypothetical protein
MVEVVDEEVDDDEGDRWYECPILELLEERFDPWQVCISAT